MTTLLILIGAFAAVSALVAFNVWIGGWSPSRIESIEDAGETLRQDLLIFEPGEKGVLASDGLAALVESRDGKFVGYLSARGDTLVSRLIEPGSVARANVRDGGVIMLHFKDFTFPTTRITLGDDDAAREWAERLSAE
ncbi:hypothetical protein L5876_03355 [Hyphobacterium sp. SN044]|uniref:hypothetical protein n=1 Tax=Hyphobacterium sp. SN044 TaxID=2912575 RepID=UPI001F41669D|nr:hypothetical protein [Hyphobacterium sp. SN044]MCF8878849.1 hypothetical protein [Hyphobacterium sp. SN044]